MPAQGPPMAAAKVDVWRRRIAAALEATKPAIEQGKTNVERYMGKYLASAPTSDQALVPTDFYYIESKKARLFYRLPDVYVKPEQPGLDDAAVVFQAALNKELGPAGVNVLPTVQQVIFDLLCPTGWGALSVGYQTILGEPVEVPMGIGPDGAPVTAPAPNITAAWYFIEHVRPGDLLVAVEFSGLDFDKAPWIGQRFREDMPDAETGGSMDTDERRLLPLPTGAQAGLRKQRTGYEVWYRAHLFDADVQHPDKIRTFKVYDDDKDAPVVVRDHPHQRYANTAGKLESGMRGYPIAPVTLRYISDTWMPPSDATMARNTADELSRGRTQMLKARDRNLPVWGYDATRVDKDIQAKIEKNEIGAGIGFNGPGADATWEITKGGSPRETYAFNSVAQLDLDRIWRTPPNSRGELDTASRTATEQQIASTASQEAEEADRSVVMAWYAKVATKFASLLQLYATEQQFVELVGADAQRLTKVPPEVQQQAQQAGQDGRVMVPWNNDLLKGLFSYSVKPNSQVFIDAAQEAKRLMDDYQFFANSPTINKTELERQILTRRGYDTSKVMQAMPPKQPPQPTVSLSAKGDDMDPQSVQGASMVLALAKLGVPVDPATIQIAQQTMQSAQQMTAQLAEAGLLVPHPPLSQQPKVPAQTEHGGAVAQAEPLSKHQTDQTGGMQGTGQQAPFGAGGMR